MKRRYADAFVRIGDTDGAPVRVVLGMRQPVEVVRRGARDFRDVGERQPLVGVGQVIGGTCHRLAIAPAAAEGVRRQTRQCPVEIEAQTEGPTLVRPSLVVVGPGDPRRDRGEMGWSSRRRVQLIGADVGSSEHANLAGAPWLSGCPFDGVEAVFPLGSEWIERAIRGKSSARVLGQDRVPGTRGT
jgi:hypothetical protein